MRLPLTRQHAAAATFRDNIESLCKRSSKDHAYPRPDLINLSQYLSDQTIYRSQGSSLGETLEQVEADAASDFALLHPIESGDSARFTGLASGLASFVAFDTPPEPSLLFMRGFASPQWLTAVGETYQLSPELYRRHLDFPAFTSAGRSLYSSPSIPSSSTYVFQLTVPTICIRNVSVPDTSPRT